MATGAKPIIIQERKRLAFVASMAFLAGFFFYVRADLYIGGIHISLITGTVYAVIIGACALVVCIALPSMRFMIDAIAVSRLLISLFVVAAPSVGYQLLANPFLMAFATVAGGVAVSRVIHGRLLRDESEDNKGRLFTKNLFKRLPVRVVGSPRQQRFVHWLEDTKPA